MSSETNDPSPALQRKMDILFVLHSLLIQAVGTNIKLPYILLLQFFLSFYPVKECQDNLFDL